MQPLKSKYDDYFRLYWYNLVAKVFPVTASLEGGEGGRGERGIEGRREGGEGGEGRGGRWGGGLRNSQ